MQNPGEAVSYSGGFVHVHQTRHMSVRDHQQTGGCSVWLCTTSRHYMFISAVTTPSVNRSLRKHANAAVLNGRRWDLGAINSTVTAEKSLLAVVITSSL